MPDASKLYPLLLQPILLPKVWGGDRLARFGKAVATGAKVGESWEVADLATTSASGAGGAAAISVITNGPLAGRTLNDALLVWERELLGESVPTTPGNGRFPLLVKFLDARENLSVQVHPSIAYAKAHPGASIKTECWYILDADPGAVIYKGVKPGVTRAIFEKHLCLGDGSAILDDLVAVPAHPGEMHNLPSGTIHALGAGVLVAEVQTPSDTTFRVFDWGRSGRELHRAEALECIHFGPARDATRLAPDVMSGRLVSTGFFTVDKMRIHPDAEVGLADPDTPRRPVVLMVVEGDCLVRSRLGAFEATRAPLGSTLVIPACLAGACVLSGRATVLRVNVLG